MGGNLFKSPQCMDKKIYAEIKKYIQDMLIYHGLECGREYVFTVPVGEKETFNDIDILLKSSYSEKVKWIFNDHNIVKNDNVFSLLFLGIYQVDFIEVRPENFEMSKIFFNYNDMGNLIGRLSKHFYMKFTPNGFYMVIYSEDRSRKINKYFISKDIPSIFKFLDIDYDRYLKGFDTYNEVFEFITSSKYFDVMYYKKGIHVNSKSYSRDLKRKTYVKFLKYIDTLDSKERLPRIEYLEAIRKVDMFFGTNVEEKYKRDVENYKMGMLANSKFNGNMIKEMFPYKEGKAIGDMVLRFKKMFDFENKEKFLNRDIDVYMELSKMESLGDISKNMERVI